MAGATRIILSGATGRMGRTVAGLAAGDPSFAVVGGIDRDSADRSPGDPLELVSPTGAASLLEGSDAVIDFSAPEFLTQLLEANGDALRGVALVVGTTGLGDDEERLLNGVAERSPVLTAANFSVGVNLLLSLVESAARALGPEYDIEIVETHHRRKEDAPSGTALALGESIARGRGQSLGPVRRDGRTGRPGARPEGEIGFHSLRGGDIIGDHQVHFIGEVERLELTHRASDRALFAAGALRAVRWLAGREPGRYSMRDVLGL
ncbi:MAG TPA: 4-hydroxy-tetrahydrodipicolinate reductase [Longimicrobiaceae bacterium]|nr:4-hydroxy-tetrahydrodipicolinate reductase [Longimicrobiaceae bacterium]